MESNSVCRSGGKHGLDALQGLIGAEDVLGSSPRADEAGAEHERGELAAGEHQWRKVHVAAQRVANAGLAFNRSAGELEVLDVAIDGALRDLEFFGELLRREQAAHAEELDDSKEPVGTTHRGKVIRCQLSVTGWILLATDNL